MVVEKARREVLAMLKRPSGINHQKLATGLNDRLKCSGLGIPMRTIQPLFCAVQPNVDSFK